MAMSFMREIQITAILTKWGCTFSEADEIIAALNRGENMNKLLSQYAPRLRNSRAFKLDVKDKQLLAELNGELFA